MRSQNGFTLLEIMLAILVLGLVVSMVTVSLSGSLRVIEATDRQGELYRQAGITMQRLSDDLRSALLTSGTEFIGNKEGEEGGRTDNLHFSTHAHLVLDPEHQQPGTALVEYRIEEDKTQSGSYLLFRSDTLLRPLEEDGELEVNPGFLLGDNLKSFQVTYLTQTGEERENWDTRETGEDQQRQLPAAVVLEIAFWLDQEAEDFLEFQTTVLLPLGFYGEQPEA